MKQLKQTLMLLSMLLLLSPIAYADKNEEVSLWAAETLLTTLSFSYNSQPSDFAEVRKNYTINSWDAIIGFLGQHKDKIREEQLTLHPVLESVPVVVKSGKQNGISFWYVKLTVIFPEFNVKVDFGMTILARDPASSYPYVIQSISMKIDKPA